MKIFFLISLFLTGCVSTNQQIRKDYSGIGGIVVMANHMGWMGEEKHQSAKSEELSSRVEKELISNGITVVDRSLLPLSLREIKTTMDGYINQDGLNELGKIKSIKYFLTISQRNDRVVVRCVRVDTMAVLFSNQYQSSGTTEFIKRVIKDLLVNLS